MLYLMLVEEEAVVWTEVWMSHGVEGVGPARARTPKGGFPGEGRRSVPKRPL